MSAFSVFHFPSDWKTALNVTSNISGINATLLIVQVLGLLFSEILQRIKVLIESVTEFLRNTVRELILSLSQSTRQLKP